MKRSNFLAAVASLFAWRKMPAQPALPTGAINAEALCVHGSTVHAGDFDTCRLVYDRWLSDDEIRQIAECTATRLSSGRLFVECNNEHWFESD